MISLPCCVRAAAIAATLSTFVPTTTHAQMRRRAGSDGGPPDAGAVRGIPRDARRPFAGVWDGSMHLTGGPMEKMGVPRTIVVDVADTARSGYTSATILPDGARAPNVETAVTKGEMHWKSPNSGGGFWLYTVRFVTPDSLTGTVALKEWPQLPVGEKAPAGSIALVRRPPGR